VIDSEVELELVHKEAIVAVPVQQHAQQLVACTESPLIGAHAADPHRAIQAVVHAGIEAHRMNISLHKVRTQQVPRVDAIKVAMDTSKVLTERLALFFEAHRVLLNERDPQMAAFVVETVAEALTHRATIERHDALATGDIEAEALELVTTYLFGRRSTRLPKQGAEALQAEESRRKGA
jgi:Tetracyclin repressor-like, C-terminal domain